LHHRLWICQGCHTLHDRDLNAAVNLERHVPAERRERIPQGYTPSGITPVESASPTLGVQPQGLVETGSPKINLWVAHFPPAQIGRLCPA
jgi:hypothetical protein